MNIKINFTNTEDIVVEDNKTSIDFFFNSTQDSIGQATNMADNKVRFVDCFNNEFVVNNSQELGDLLKDLFDPSPDQIN